jgi:hypothetical protein
MSVWHVGAAVWNGQHPTGLIKLLLLLLLCSCYRGYVGTWTTFDMQHSDCSRVSSPDAAPTAAAAAATARVTPKYVDQTVNFRLFKLEDSATMEYCQVTKQKPPLEEERTVLKCRSFEHLIIQLLHHLHHHHHQQQPVTLSLCCAAHSLCRTLPARRQRPLL